MVEAPKIRINNTILVGQCFSPLAHHSRLIVACWPLYTYPYTKIFLPPKCLRERAKIYNLKVTLNIGIIEQYIFCDKIIVGKESGYSYSMEIINLLTSIVALKSFMEYKILRISYL